MCHLSQLKYLVIQFALENNNNMDISGTEITRMEKLGTGSLSCMLIKCVLHFLCVVFSTIIIAYRLLSTLVVTYSFKKNNPDE